MIGKKFLIAVTRISLLGLLISLSACSTETYLDSNLNETATQPSINHIKAAQLNVELGVSYLEKGEYQRAKAKLLRANELAPKLPMVHYAMGYYYEAIGELLLADTAYQKALKLNPTGGREHNNYATFLCRQREYEDADKHFLIALSDTQYTESADALENAGLCQLQAKNNDKALSYFERAARQDPSRQGIWLEMAWIQFRKDEFDSAKFLFERYDATQHDLSARGLYLKAMLAKHFHSDDTYASATLILRSQFPESQEAQMIQKLP